MPTPRANHLTVRNRYRNGGIALLMLLGSFVNSAVASERPDYGLSSQERDPIHWIEKMGTALIEENYRGVFTIARGREFNSIEIDHRYQDEVVTEHLTCLLYTSPSPRDVEESRMPSSA